MYCVLLELEIFGCCYHVEGKVQHMLGITIGVMKHFPALEKVSDFYKVETAHYCRFLKVQNEWVVFKNDRFFPKTKRSFLKTIEKRIKND